MKNLFILFLLFSCHTKPVLKSVPVKPEDEGITVTINMGDSSHEPSMKVVSNTPHIIVDSHVTISHDTADINREWRRIDSMNLADSLERLKLK